MFTGIVEEVGTITEINKIAKEAIQLTIQAHLVTEDVKVGDSIAVNGICLTVTDFQATNIQVDVMPETMRATSLIGLEVGSNVNLERSLQPTGRIGGHFVTGHVDGVGEVVRKQVFENAVYYDVHIPKSFINYFMMKGSVAIDGVSLTVFGISYKENVITMSLIPHTLSVTILGEKKVGDIVNFECDMLVKHVLHYLENTLDIVGGVNNV